MQITVISSKGLCHCNEFEKYLKQEDDIIPNSKTSINSIKHN